ncbi:thrombospondin type 1 domain protein, partial [Trichinella nativa]
MSTDGQWSAWQSWSSCTDTCGEHSVKHRLRLCNNPKPAFGGQYCKGSGLETIPCPRLPCPGKTSKVDQADRLFVLLWLNNSEFKLPKNNRLDSTQTPAT